MILLIPRERFKAYDLLPHFFHRVFDVSANEFAHLLGVDGHGGLGSLSLIACRESEGLAVGGAAKSTDSAETAAFPISLIAVRDRTDLFSETRLFNPGRVVGDRDVSSVLTVANLNIDLALLQALDKPFFKSDVDLIARVLNIFAVDDLRVFIETCREVVQNILADSRGVRRMCHDRGYNYLNCL